MGTLTKGQAQMITSKTRVQNKLQQEFNTKVTGLIYNKVLQTRVTLQTSEFKRCGKYNKVETSFKVQYDR